MGYQDLKTKVGIDPHDLAEAIQVDTNPPAVRVHQLFEAFEDIPSYGILMYLGYEYEDANEPLRLEILSKLRGYLEGQEEKRIKWVLYALWCDFFEDPRTVEKAWEFFTSENPSRMLLRRVLPASGPVPWHLKKPVIESLLPDNSWHSYLYECLLYSQFDYFGKIKPEEALLILKALELPETTAHLAKLYDALETNAS